LKKYGLYAFRYVIPPSRFHSNHPPIVFILLAWKVEPRNYLLFACHITNATAQLTQGYRFVDYWYRGGKEKKLIQTASPSDAAKGKVTEAVKAARAASQSTK
jgi:mitochondrial pyruvate carrier 1